MDKNVKVIETQTGETLFSCTMEELESAYNYASSVEKMGIEVKVSTPTITQTLADSLRIPEEQQMEYQASVDEELHDHDGQELTDSQATSE